MRIVKEESPEILEQSYDMDCLMRLRIRKSMMGKLRARLEKVETARILDEELEEVPEVVLSLQKVADFCIFLRFFSKNYYLCSNLITLHYETTDRLNMLLVSPLRLPGGSRP